MTDKPTRRFNNAAMNPRDAARPTMRLIATASPSRMPRPAGTMNTAEPGTPANAKPETYAKLAIALREAKHTVYSSRIDGYQEQLSSEYPARKTE